MCGCYDFPIWNLDGERMFLCNSIKRWYCQLKMDKVYDKSDCWNLVCKWVHRIMKSFILLYQWVDMHIWGVILVLCFPPTSGHLSVPIQL